MTLSKKVAMLMLVAVLSWTAAPAVACLSGGSQHHHDCCAEMMPDCGDSMSASCCQLAPTSKPPAVASEYAPESCHLPDLHWHEALLPNLNLSSEFNAAFNALASPDPSPGALSVLRI